MIAGVSGFTGNTTLVHARARSKKGAETLSPLFSSITSGRRRGYSQSSLATARKRKKELEQ